MRLIFSTYELTHAVDGRYDVGGGWVATICGRVVSRYDDEGEVSVKIENGHPREIGCSLCLRGAIRKAR